MLDPRRGEIWRTDLGIKAKVRPCLVLTDPPKTNDLVLYTVVPHTTSLRGSEWEVNIPKNFLKPGVFHVQQIQTVGRFTLEQRLGTLTDEELSEIKSRIQKLLGIT
jgi:mRNA interferase MazF